MVRIAVILSLVLCLLAAVDIYGTSLHGGREPKEEKAPEETFEVSGTVVDPDGEAQPQARVSFAGPKRAETWTDEAGAFRFEGPVGDYKVTVKIDGKSQTFTVTLTEDGLQPSKLVFRED